MTRDKIRFIPNWATLSPGVRPIRPDNRYRRAHSARFVVGLSGNLGFTHDPLIVFEAARLLRDDPDIHFLLSGWGIGFDRLKQMQSEAELRKRHAGRPRRGRRSRGVAFGRERLAHSLSQERRRRLGPEPVLQSAGGRPARHSGFRTRRRGGADRHANTTSAGLSRPATPPNLPRRSVVGLCVEDPIAGRTRRRSRRAIQFRRRRWPATAALVQELCSEDRRMKARSLRGARPRKPVHRQRHAEAADDHGSTTSTAADCVLVDAIASTARPTLSANTSLTTRNTENPLSVAR